MGGFLARVDQWQRFQRAFGTLKKKYDFNIFHTVKFKNRKDDFKGWPDSKIAEFMLDFRQITSFGLTDSVVISLDNKSFRENYKIEPTKLDSAYGLCFRNCLIYFLLEAMKRKRNGGFPKLHVVIESGHRNVGDAKRIFSETKLEFGAIGILQTLTIADKNRCDPLMIADFAAHSTLMLQKQARINGTSTPRNQQVPKGYVGMTHLESTPEGLANIRTHATKMAELHKKVRLKSKKLGL